MNGRILETDQVHLGFTSTGETAKNSHKMSAHPIGLTSDFFCTEYKHQCSQNTVYKAACRILLKSHINQ